MSRSLSTTRISDNQRDYLDLMYHEFKLCDDGVDQGMGPTSKHQADKKKNAIWSVAVNRCHGPEKFPAPIPRKFNYFYLHLTPEILHSLSRQEEVATLHELILSAKRNKGYKIWTYLIGYNVTKKKIVAKFSPVWGSAEITTKHAHLYNSLARNTLVDIHVLASGEIKVDTTTKKVRFNILSGTFMNSSNSTLDSSYHVSLFDIYRTANPKSKAILERINKTLKTQLDSNLHSKTRDQTISQTLFQELFFTMIHHLFREDSDPRSIGLKSQTASYTIEADKSFKSYIKPGVDLREFRQICARVNYGLKKANQVPFYLFKNSQDCEVSHRYYEWKHLSTTGSHALKIFNHFEKQFRAIEKFEINSGRVITSRTSTRTSTSTSTSTSTRTSTRTSNSRNVTLKKRTMRSSSLDKDDFRLRGCIIDRFWEIGKQLGRGAFGTVYETIGIDLQKAAIKIMPFFVYKKDQATIEQLNRDYQVSLNNIHNYRHGGWAFIRHLPTPRKILDLIESKQDELSGRKIKIPTPDLSRELGNLLKTGAFNDFYGIRDGEREMISPRNSLNNWFNTVSVATNSDGTGIDLQMSYLVLPFYSTNITTILEGPVTSINSVKMFGYNLVAKMRDIYEFSFEKYRNYLTHLDIKPDNIMCNSFTQDPVPMDWGISRLESYRRKVIYGDFVGTLAWSSPWTSTYTPILLDDLVSVGYILCELAQIKKDGLVIWKDSLAKDEISLQNSKLQFFDQLKRGRLDGCFPKATRFIKDYFLALYSEHEKLVAKEDRDPLGGEGICNLLLRILQG